jgi:hypothetical protein
MSIKLLEILSEAPVPAPAPSSVVALVTA